MADPTLLRPNSFLRDSTDGLLETTLSPYRATSRRRPPAFSELQIRDISEGLRRNGDISWSKTPRLYAVLFMIDNTEILDAFISEGASDSCLPFTQETLPEALEDHSVRLEFLKLQQLVLTNGLDLERADGRHWRLHNSDDLPLQHLEEIGNGSTGRVDRVLSTISQKEYARRLVPIKKTFNKNKDALKNFEHTLGDLKRLAHQHIVQVVGSYNDSRHVGILMAPIADENLKNFLDRVTLSTAEKSCLRATFGCLTAALKYLHENQVLHGDIRPQNVLIKGQKVFLSDFGLSTCRTDPDLSIHPRTLQYCAPEVASRLRSDWSSDMWSLGCVFVELWTVLNGQSVSALLKYFSDQGSTSICYHLNLLAITQWCDDLEAHSTSLDDRAPRAWIRNLLLADSVMRWTTKQLSDHINQTNDDPDSKYSFSGRCCIDLDDSDDSTISSNYSLQAGETQSSQNTSKYAPTTVSSNTIPELPLHNPTLVTCTTTPIPCPKQVKDALIKDNLPPEGMSAPGPDSACVEREFSVPEPDSKALNASHIPHNLPTVDAVDALKYPPSLESSSLSFRHAIDADLKANHHVTNQRYITNPDTPIYERPHASIPPAENHRMSLSPVQGSEQTAMFANPTANHSEHQFLRPNNWVSSPAAGSKVSHSHLLERPPSNNEYPNRDSTANVTAPLPNQPNQLNIPAPPYSKHPVQSSLSVHSATHPQPGLQVASPSQPLLNVSSFTNPALPHSVLPDSIVDDITAFDLEGQCSICDKVLSLDETSYQARGKFLCHYHFVFTGAKTCEGCDTVILPLPSESPDHISLQRWHVECYMLQHHFDLRLLSVHEWQTTVLLNTNSTYEHTPTLDERQSLRTHLSQMADGRRNIWNALFAFCWRVGLPLEDLLMTGNGTSLNTSTVERVESIVTEVKILFLALNKVNEQLNEHNLEGLGCQPQMTLLTKTLLGFLISTVADETRSQVTLSEHSDIIRNVVTIFKYLIQIGMGGASRLERLQPQRSRHSQNAPGPLWRFFFKLNGRCCTKNVTERDKSELKTYLLFNDDVCPECKESLFGDLCAVRTGLRAGESRLPTPKRYHWKCQRCQQCSKPMIEAVSTGSQSRWKQRRDKIFGSSICDCSRVFSPLPQMVPPADHLIFLWHTTMARYALLCRPVDWVPRKRSISPEEAVSNRFADEYGISWKSETPLYVDNVCKIESLLDVGNLRHSSHVIQHWLDINKSTVYTLADRYKPFTSSKGFSDVDFGFFKHCARILDMWEDAQTAWPYEINELGDTSTGNELDPVRLRSELESRARMELEGNSIRMPMFELEATEPVQTGRIHNQF